MRRAAALEENGPPARLVDFPKLSPGSTIFKVELNVGMIVPLGVP
jgi:hypothetical protein